MHDIIALNKQRGGVNNTYCTWNFTVESRTNTDHDLDRIITIIVIFMRLLAIFLLVLMVWLLCVLGSFVVLESRSTFTSTNWTIRFCVLAVRAISEWCCRINDGIVVESWIILIVIVVSLERFIRILFVVVVVIPFLFFFIFFFVIGVLGKDELFIHSESPTHVVAVLVMYCSEGIFKFSISFKAKKIINFFLVIYLFLFILAFWKNLIEFWQFEWLNWNNKNIIWKSIWIFQFNNLFKNKYSIYQPLIIIFNSALKWVEKVASSFLKLLERFVWIYFVSLIFINFIKSPDFSGK